MSSGPVGASPFEAGVQAGSPPAVGRYAVVGNPVEHSLSPQIHAAFARETGRAVDYRRLPAPLDGFVATVRAFVADGGLGLNVTVPFKRDAYALCGAQVSERARRAGAVNCIALTGEGLRGDGLQGEGLQPGGLQRGGLRGDNTDGVGLVTDLERLASAAGWKLADARVLLVGAGGAARGAVGPLLDAGVAALAIANRDATKAGALVDAFADHPAAALLAAGPLAAFEASGDRAFDVVVNATSASLAHAELPLAPSLFAEVRLAYDLMYGARATPFMTQALRGGAACAADGLGMLVEQAAESFAIWHGVRPATAPVLDSLRARLAAESGR